MYKNLNSKKSKSFYENGKSEVPKKKQAIFTNRL